jgi:transcriptional regulator with PAS, ATPase and Fis domain
MSQAISLAKKVAPSNINVLIVGETGVGKEVMTSNIHRWSSRAAGPLVCVNCAGLNENLLESELFGHEKGSFTGAVQKVGLLELAQEGTILLDEIGELSLALQAKLLRVLQERKLRRVGGLKEIALNVRFIAATNRDLEAGAGAGTFRQDLFFRLNGATILVPPLRERQSEIVSLTQRFIEEASREMRFSSVPSLTPQAQELLLGYGWPGNVRELKNVVERAVLLSNGDDIDVQHLPLERLRLNRKTPVNVEPAVPDGLSAAQLKERQKIMDALARCAWNQTAAAEHLQMPRRTLVAKLRAYAIPRPRAGRAADDEPTSSRPRA